MAHDATTASTDEVPTSQAEAGALTSVANPRRIRLS